MIRSTITGVRVATSLGGEVVVDAASAGMAHLVLVVRDKAEPLRFEVSVEHLECLRLAIGTFLQWQAHQ